MLDPTLVGTVETESLNEMDLALGDDCLLSKLSHLTQALHRLQADVIKWNR
jgi:hypothetical protein